MKFLFSRAKSGPNILGLIICLNLNGFLVGHGLEGERLMKDFFYRGKRPSRHKDKLGEVYWAFVWNEKIEAPYGKKATDKK